MPGNHSFYWKTNQLPMDKGSIDLKWKYATSNLLNQYYCKLDSTRIPVDPQIIVVPEPSPKFLWNRQRSLYTTTTAQNADNNRSQVDAYDTSKAQLLHLKLRIHCRWWEGIREDQRVRKLTVSLFLQAVLVLAVWLPKHKQNKDNRRYANVKVVI